jgi:beta-lactamase class A
VYIGRHSLAAAKHPTVSTTTEERVHDTKRYQFTNPLLDCGELAPLSTKTVITLEKQLRDLIDTQTKQGTIDSASVYFRELANGSTFGINSNTQFAPASLFKVPLLIGVLKQAEADPSLLKKTSVYKGPSQDKGENFQPSKQIELNKPYTVDQLLEYMIRYSDNTAMYALSPAIDANQLHDSFDELGVENPAQGQYTLSVKTYASFFRILYNASYLSSELSEHALHLLSLSDFNNGLVAGVPAGTTVAHKFGERSLPGVTDTKQLHDCGIIYQQHNPYVLCVMTRGKSFDSLTPFIQQVSKTVWTAIDTNSK